MRAGPLLLFAAQRDRLAQHQHDDVARARAERNASAHLADAAVHDVADDAVDAAD